WLGDGHPQREYLAVAPLQTPAGLVLGLGVTEVKESKESFTLAAFSLPPNAPVTLVVDGQSLATVVTHAQGHLHGIFTTQPTGEQLPLPEELRPVASWHRLELRSTAGELLASGEFSQIARPGTATAPGQVRRWLGRPPR
ncbi:MAG: hypothetical protein N2447_09750, partial [Thermoanaerobaculum sp.]|nr:hypothetical protein [Thermoanaerobaculum sp.]